MMLDEENVSCSPVKALLVANLREHVETCKKKADSESYLRYCDEKARISKTYSNPPHNMSWNTLTGLAATVEAEEFAESRRTVARLLSILQEKVKESEADDSETAITISSLSSFFPPWRERSYNCLDYLAVLGGLPLLVDLAQSSDYAYSLRRPALLVCWSFSNGSRRCHMLAERGIIDVIEKILREDAKLRWAACGIVSNLAEYPDIRNHLAARGVVSLLVNLLAYNSDVNIKELALTCLLLFSPNISQMDVSKRNAFEDVIFESFETKGEEEEIQVPPMVYYLGYNCLANIYFHESKQKNDKGNSANTSSILAKMDQWMNKTNPDVIRSKEIVNYTWNSLKPFTSLLYCPYPVVRRMGAFSLANLLQGADNRRLFYREEGQSFAPIQCTAWCRDPKSRFLAKKAMQHVLTDQPTAPSLKSICLFFVSDNFSLFDSMVDSLPVLLKSKLVSFSQ